MLEGTATYFVATARLAVLLAQVVPMAFPCLARREQAGAGNSRTLIRQKSSGWSAPQPMRRALP